MTTKGQVTIPKHIREALHLVSGDEVEFALNAEGEVVIQSHRSIRPSRRAAKDGFEVVRGRADVRWKTDALMKLLRADDR
tara:strand:- start:593 stop:832 length:240 start_codon:yes stop_codon:yes gene_type:complete